MNEENKFTATKENFEEPKKGRKLIFIIVALLIVVIAIVGVYMLRLNQARYIFDQKISQYFDATENVDYHTMKVNADLSVSVDGVDAEVQEIADFVNDAKLSIQAEVDSSTQEEIVGLKLIKNEQELLGINAKLENATDNMYMKLGELFDKTINMKISEVYDTDVAMLTTETVNPKASSIMMKELKAQLKDEYFSKEKANLENENLTKNTMKLPLEDVVVIIQNICENLSNNEEFLNCFANSEEIKVILQDIKDEVNNYIFEEDEFLTIDVYTKGVLKEIVRVDVSMDFEGDNYRMAFTKLSETEYSYVLYVEDEEQLSGKINYVNNENDFSIEFSVKTEGTEVALKLAGNVVYDETLSDFDTSNAVDFEELTMDDIYTIMGNFMSSELYGIFQDMSGNAGDLDFDDTTQEGETFESNENEDEF